MADLTAFVDGVSVLNEDRLNSLLMVAPTAEIYEGSQIDAKTGTGVTENSVASYSYCFRVKATGVTELSRIELEIDKDNEGADLSIDILDDDFNPDGSAEGTVLGSILIPKEFIPESATYMSIPLNIRGLSEGQDVWVRINKAGDSTNKLDIVGESSTDVDHPAYYRAGSSGEWTENNALHFRAFSGRSGELLHSMYEGCGFESYEYDDELLTKVYYYLPPDGIDGPGLRQIETLVWDGEYLDRSEVE